MAYYFYDIDLGNNYTLWKDIVEEGEPLGVELLEDFRGENKIAMYSNNTSNLEKLQEWVVLKVVPGTIVFSQIRLVRQDL